MIEMQLAFWEFWDFALVRLWWQKSALLRPKFSTVKQIFTNKTFLWGWIHGTFILEKVQAYFIITYKHIKYLGLFL